MCRAPRQATRKLHHDATTLFNSRQRDTIHVMQDVTQMVDVYLMEVVCGAVRSRDGRRRRCAPRARRPAARHQVREQYDQFMAAMPVLEASKHAADTALRK